MVVDTSALIAILLGEPEHEAFSKALAGAGRVLIPASVYLETGIVLLFRRGERAVPILDELLRNARHEIMSFDAVHATIALDAYTKYGRGRHRAGLNFGDCISYALAKTEMTPLLFKGDDFRLTDIEAAL